MFPVGWEDPIDGARSISELDDGVCGETNDVPTHPVHLSGPQLHRHSHVLRVLALIGCFDFRFATMHVDIFPYIWWFIWKPRCFVSALFEYHLQTLRGVDLFEGGRNQPGIVTISSSAA